MTTIVKTFYETSDPEVKKNAEEFIEQLRSGKIKKRSPYHIEDERHGD